MALVFGPQVCGSLTESVEREWLVTDGLGGYAMGTARAVPASCRAGRPGARAGCRAYHQGTAWPWLIGAYVGAALRAGLPVAGVLSGLDAHLGDWGLGSVSETVDGDPPHAATGCPFQAWSLAEVLRARRMLDDAGDDLDDAARS